MTSVYLDYAATTPVDTRVADLVYQLMIGDFGNAGSRTHEYGATAARFVERAREQVADVVQVEASGVIFTSGATEANNLALLGLEEEGRRSGRMHIVSTSIEHKAVLEPLEVLAARGFEVDLVAPNIYGAVDPDEVLAAVRDDTLLVSVMHVNNETGVRQPIERIAEQLDSATYFHTDASQGFGKDIEALRHHRIDLISVSGHKLSAPKGVGALLRRRRSRRFAPVVPLMHGGGQERGLRPGTQPVPLIAGFGLAVELALREHEKRLSAALRTRQAFLEALCPLGAVVNGDPQQALPHILNISVPGIDSEAAILAVRSLVAISNGSACTSSSYEPSHVLRAMGLDDERIRGAIRISWGAEDLTEVPLDFARTLAELQ